LRVYMLKDNIEMEIKEMAIMVSGLHSVWSFIRSQISATILGRHRWISWSVLNDAPANTLCGTACLCSVMQASQQTAVPKITYISTEYFNCTRTTTIVILNESNLLSHAHTHAMKQKWEITKTVYWCLNRSKIGREMKKNLHHNYHM
jgi:hypothetical protein